MKYKILLFVAILFSILLVITSCEPSQSTFITGIDDSTKKVILSYIKENKINTRKKVITTKWLSNLYRTDIYISNSYADVYKKEKYTPTCYSVLNDSIIVFIYSGMEPLIKRDTKQITTEITQTLEKNDVTLSIDSGFLYYAPAWMYTVCESGNKLVKKSSPYEWNYIPCGYTLLQHKQEKDSLIF